MMIFLVAAFALGFVSGLRVMTGIAAAVFLRFGFGHPFYTWGSGLAALGEYVVDLAPQTPARTQIGSQIVRALAGGFAGWTVADKFAVSPIASTVVGIIGAFAGTHLGFRARMWATARFGTITPALVEDALAIALAVGAVSALPR